MLSFLPPPHVLVSELASEGASGRLLCQVSGSTVQPSFWPSCKVRCVLIGKVSGPPSDFCYGVTLNSVTPNFGQKSTNFFDRLRRYGSFWARTFGPKTRVTIQRWPTIDQLFWSFTKVRPILSSNVWSENSCHDRDQVLTDNWPAF